jgi:hypothetical protein
VSDVEQFEQWTIEGNESLPTSSLTCSWYRGNAVILTSLWARTTNNWVNASHPIGEIAYWMEVERPLSRYLLELVVCMKEFLQAFSIGLPSIMGPAESPSSSLTLEKMSV